MLSLFCLSMLSLPLAQEKKPTPQEMQEGMARWMETCKLDEHHKKIGGLLGKWETTMKMWGMGPEGEPMVSKGEAEVTWFLEGRWIEIKSKGSMMGMPVTSRTILGFDKFKKRYVATFVDSMTTTMLSASGLFDQEQKHLTLWGWMDEPAVPEQDKMVKYVWRNFAADKMTFEIHDMMIGETNTKVIEFEYVRKK